jgi:hypothetical protein
VQAIRSDWIVATADIDTVADQESVKVPFAKTTLSGLSGFLGHDEPRQSTIPSIDIQ